MYRLCTTDRASQMQQQYEQCLLELMRKKSYEDITVGDICEKMGTTRKSYYYYFKNKEGCLSSLIDRTVSTNERYRLPAGFDLRGFPEELMTWLAYTKETKPLYDLLLKNDLFEFYTDRLINCSKINRVLQWLKISASDHIEDALLFYTNGSMAIVKCWIQGGCEESIYEIAETLYQLISGGWIVK